MMRVLLCLFILLPLIATAQGLPPDYLRYLSGTNAAPGAQITPENAHRLERVWTYNTGEEALVGAEKFANSALQGRPLLVEDSLIFCTAFSRVVALDPVTGAEKWVHDPEIDLSISQPFQHKCRGAVAVWQDNEAPDDTACSLRVISHTLDFRLIALDARTGQPCEDFGDGGEMAVLTPEESEAIASGLRLTTTPIVIGDTVILGSAVTDSIAVDIARGTVRAFDVRTGARKWVFDPIPQRPDDPRLAGWQGGDPAAIGGGNVWTIIAADPDLGMIYLPTSSPSVDLFGGYRPGPNRDSNSVVALNAETGAVVWVQQILRHDVWDYDLPAQPILTDLTIDGEAIPALIQNTKQGLVFVYDRRDGTPLFPIEDRPVPASDVAGEALSPTQPFPAALPPLVPLTLAAEDAWGGIIVDRNACRARIEELRNEGLYTPPSLQGTLMRPSFFGGANWGGASIDPATGLMILPVSTVPSILRLEPRDTPPGEATESHASFVDGPIVFPAEGTPFRAVLEPLLSPLGAPCSAPPWYELVALDFERREIAWRAPLGTTSEALPFGIGLNWGAPGIGGLISTAGGLTFIGAATDQRIRAFDSATGEELWSDRLPAGAHSMPVTYEIGGRQYVIVMAGGHSIIGAPPGDAIIAYALGE